MHVFNMYSHILVLYTNPIDTAILKLTSDEQEPNETMLIIPFAHRLENLTMMMMMMMVGSINEDIAVYAANVCEHLLSFMLLLKRKRKKIRNRKN